MYADSSGPAHTPKNLGKPVSNIFVCYALSNGNGELNGHSNKEYKVHTHTNSDSMTEIIVWHGSQGWPLIWDKLYTIKSFQVPGSPTLQDWWIIGRQPWNQPGTIWGVWWLSHWYERHFQWQNFIRNVTKLTKICRMKACFLFPWDDSGASKPCNPSHKRTPV